MYNTVAKRRLVPYVEIISSAPKKRSLETPEDTTSIKRLKQAQNNCRSITAFTDGPRSSPPPTSLSSEGPAFVPSGHELLEDEDLVIIGETPLDESTGEPDDIPVRRLSQFHIFESDTLKLVPVTCLWGTSGDAHSACGLVGPWAEDGLDPLFEDDEDEDADQLVMLSDILELDAHHYDEEQRKLDGKIYIRTKYAWYILEEPAENYKPFFRPFSLQHQVLHELIQLALISPTTTYTGFIQFMEEKYFTPEFIESDDIKSYFYQLLPDLLGEGLPVDHVPVIQEILAPLQLLQEKKQRKRQFISKHKGPVQYKHQLETQSCTVVTPTVSRIAKNLFRGTLETAGNLSEDIQDALRLPHELFKGHNHDPESIVWGDLILPRHKYYSSVVLDGVVYEIGDVVMLHPGVDDDQQRAKTEGSKAAQSANKYGNCAWFCRICYFFEGSNGDKLVHGQWFVHGSKTLLQETAHSRSLFLTNKCDDNAVAAILQKCTVHMLKLGEEEPIDDGDPDRMDYFCSLLWDEEHAAFLDLPSKEESDKVLMNTHVHMPCFACGINLQKISLQEVEVVPNGWCQYGITYHMYDFIYLMPERNHMCYEIAQVVDINLGCNLVTVRYLARQDDFKVKDESQKKSVMHQRQLCFLTKRETISINLIQGLCFVQMLADLSAIEEWCQEKEHFWACYEQEKCGDLVPLSTFQTCQKCLQEHLAELEKMKEFKLQHKPLNGLELFSGAGGLGTGLDMSGFVQTKWAVELSPSAAATYQKNHPETIVYCQDTSLLLKHAIERHEQKNPAPLKSHLELNSKYCPLMPEKGEVDFIYGGPPCQAFSGANHSRKADDIRSTLPGNMLSYLEFYDADYFLLENVKGILAYPLMSEQAERCLQGGVKAGVVKFIMRTLIALGYQVHFKLLQAAHYGAPQGRLRVIFLGAKRGLKLPSFPEPTHVYPGGAHFVLLPTGAKVPPVTRSKKSEDYHQCGPFKGITIDEAIGDLPPFDWINPHKLVAATSKTKAEDRYRIEKLGIPAFNAISSSRTAQFEVGFLKPVLYVSPPQNQFQFNIRQENGKLVSEHITKSFNAMSVEGTTTIPLKGDACHHDLPLVLKPRYTISDKHANKVFYGRLDGNSHFKTALTTLTPILKNIYPLHPSQHRIYTIRECARAQGFPDSYEFVSVEKNISGIIGSKIRQIGNAVPVQLAVALGNALGNALATGQTITVLSDLELKLSNVDYVLQRFRRKSDAYPIHTL